MLVTDLPTDGYRRVHALLHRKAQQTGRAAPNPKRVYRVMKIHGLLLKPHCDNGEKVRVAFALDCCDREAMEHVATTGAITAEDVRNLMVATVEHRFGPVNRLAEPIEWLTDNGSPYVAGDTKRFARDIGYRIALELIAEIGLSHQRLLSSKLGSKASRNLEAAQPLVLRP